MSPEKQRNPGGIAGCSGIAAALAFIAILPGFSPSVFIFPYRKMRSLSDRTGANCIAVEP